MPVSLSKAHLNALKWLAERNGSGAFDRVGRLLAAGELVGLYLDGELVSAVSSATWARLMTFGMVEPDGPNRIRITELGRSCLGKRAS